VSCERSTKTASLSLCCYYYHEIHSQVARAFTDPTASTTRGGGGQDQHQQNQQDPQHRSIGLRRVPERKHGGREQHGRWPRHDFRRNQFNGRFAIDEFFLLFTIQLFALESRYVLVVNTIAPSPLFFSVLVSLTDDNDVIRYSRKLFGKWPYQ
jgi:hypothetical protein